MTVSVIVSYDGTTHDDDALVLGRLLQSAGAQISLAYVRHTKEYDPRREEIGQHDAERRLEQGALWLGDEGVPRHIVVNPSTSAGLADLARAQGADLVVFGSDYRTPPGHVEPGGAAQGLLDGGPVAVGVAAAGLRVNRDAQIKTIAVAGDGPARETAGALAAALGGAEVIDGVDADLILVDSRAGAPAGRVELDGSTRNRLDSAHGSVIVLPGSTALAF